MFTFPRHSIFFFFILSFCYLSVLSAFPFVCLLVWIVLSFSLTKSLIIALFTLYISSISFSVLSEAHVFLYLFLYPSGISDISISFSFSFSTSFVLFFFRFFSLLLFVSVCFYVCLLVSLHCSSSSSSFLKVKYSFTLDFRSISPYSLFTSSVHYIKIPVSTLPVSPPECVYAHIR